MSRNDNGRTAAEGTDQLDDRGRSFAVQLAGWLVGKKESRLFHQGAGQRDALLLAPRKLESAVAGPSLKADRAQRSAGSSLGVSRLFSNQLQG
jgi:hypothetical protein